MKKYIKLLTTIFFISFFISSCQKNNRDWNNPIDPINAEKETEPEEQQPYFQSYMIPEMVYIPSVTSFPMGCPTNWEAGDINEVPVHPVNLNAFSMSKYEITIQQYVYFLNSGDKNSHYHSDMANTTYCGIIKHGDNDYSVYAGRENYPIVYVSWYDAVAYCEWLTSKGSYTYRLPTEAQWEYAAVGTNGHRTYPWGNTFYSNYCNWQEGGSIDGYPNTAPVGSYENGKSLFGLYDMAGNVWEWCKDWYKSDYYSSSIINNPECYDSSSGKKADRGGSFGHNVNYLRCASRSKGSPDTRVPRLGFRVVRTE